MSLVERVVLIDEKGEPCGTESKHTVHRNDTPLHLGFSCYLLDQRGELLVTRRALSKQTWPGVWTNSFCGHPAPGEQLEQAVVRRAAEELSVGIFQLRLVLSGFRYRAVDASGVVENEVCPVFLARADGVIDPTATEVAEWAWTAPESLAQAVRLAPFAFSPWMRDQLPQLLDAGVFARERL